MAYQLQEALKSNTSCQPIFKDGALTLLRHRSEIPDCCFNAAQKRGDVNYIEVEAPTTRWAGGPPEVPRILPPHHFQEAIQSLNASRAQYRWPGPPSYPCLNNFPYHFSPKNERWPSSYSCHNQGCNECNRCQHNIPRNQHVGGSSIHCTRGSSNHCTGGSSNHCTGGPNNHCTGGPNNHCTGGPNNHCTGGLNNHCTGGPNNHCTGGLNNYCTGGSGNHCTGGYSSHSKCQNHHQMREPKDGIRCQSIQFPNHMLGSLKDCSECQHMPMHHHPSEPTCGRGPNLPMTKLIKGALGLGRTDCSGRGFINQTPIYMNRGDPEKFEFCIPIKNH